VLCCSATCSTNVPPIVEDSLHSLEEPSAVSAWRILDHHCVAYKGVGNQLRLTAR
jgi:hypothetical protein